MKDIIEQALQQENDERAQAKVAEAKTLIRRIALIRDERQRLAGELAELQEELRNIAPAEVMASNVLGD